MKDSTFASIGEISFRLEQFEAQLEELHVIPNKEKTTTLKKDVLAFAGTELVAKRALRGHKEAIGTLLIEILELEDTFN